MPKLQPRWLGFFGVDVSDKFMYYAVGAQVTEWKIISRWGWMYTYVCIIPSRTPQKHEKKTNKQLLLGGSWATAFPALCGVLAGLLYRSNALALQRFQLPQPLCRLLAVRAFSLPRASCQRHMDECAPGP